jgi:hypothetical protein
MGPPVMYGKSLNKEYRKRQLMRITEENQVGIEYTHIIYICIYIYIYIYIYKYIHTYMYVYNMSRFEKSHVHG